MYTSAMTAEASESNLALRFIRGGFRFVDSLAPAGDLILRIWVARVFFLSGLAKVQSVDSTILLFQYEYMVPILPPAVAAYLSMAGELGLSSLLMIGLGGRIAAAGLFILNAVAVISYPALMPAALEWHYAWGIVLLAVFLRGPGALSVDRLLARRFGW